MLEKEVQLALPKAQPGCTDEGASAARTAEHPENRRRLPQQPSTRVKKHFDQLLYLVVVVFFMLFAAGSTFLYYGQ